MEPETPVPMPSTPAQSLPMPSTPAEPPAHVNETSKPDESEPNSDEKKADLALAITPRQVWFSEKKTFVILLYSFGCEL